jgi:cytochrome c553
MTRLQRAFVTFALVAALPAAAADIEAGRRKAEPCAACHGPDGNSPNPAYPSLAGQVPIYTYYQLLQFRDQRRVNEQMSPMAARLTDADMKDIAAYYAAQKLASQSKSPDPSRAQAGGAVAAANHCGSCHMPDYSGQKHIPRLAGLEYDYLVKQLRGFKTGARPDIDGTMASAAQPLSEQDIADISGYLAGLR